MSKRNEIEPGGYYYTLIQPLDGELPCGENLEYDTAFIMLQSKLQPRQDVEYGSFVEAAEPVNWAEIERDCLSLLGKSKDIRLFIILIRCRIRRIGVAALPEGLQALEELLLRYPDDLHPRLMDEGEFDPVIRANALAELEDSNGLLMDVRNQPLPKAVGLQIAIREFEKAHASPREEGAIQETTLAAMRQAWLEQNDENIAALNTAYGYLKTIKATLEDTLAHDAPDFGRLSHILQLFNFPSETPSVPFDRIGPEPAAQGDEAYTLPHEPEGHDAITTTPGPRKAGGIGNRADALTALREVRSWFTRAEPSSPAILLLEFAESTVGKSFSELLKIVPPEIIEKMNNQTETE